MNEVEKKEIEEIKQIFADNGFEDSNGGEEIDILAHDVINAGYHKAIWHKVADGDLPDSDREVIISTSSKQSMVGIYNDFTCNDGANRFCWVDRNYDFIEDVIAWTELPKYEES